MIFVLICLFVIINSTYGLIDDVSKPRISFSITPKNKKTEFFSISNSPIFSQYSNDNQVAKAFFESKFAGIKLTSTNEYVTEHNGVFHGYYLQVIADLPVLNAFANINIKDRKVLSYGSFFTFASFDKENRSPSLSLVEAVKAVARRVNMKLSDSAELINGGYEITKSGFSLNNIKGKIALVQNEEGDKLTLVWQFVIKTDDDWWDCYVDANSGEILQMENWVDDATYNVYKPPTSDPNQGPRVVTEDSDHTSELGWHSHSNTEIFYETIGNNVYAQENIDGTSHWEDNYRPSNTSFVYNYAINFNQHPENYMDASITNLFYLNNVIHDLLYQYGFDEVSGNFQENNLGRGGEGDDAVQANAQDGAGMNNANFATPVDGERPRMRMYLWNTFTPIRDGDLENSIIMHEYGHGVSNRLTGGPNNVGCLGSGQSGGMGEGWSDWLGTWLMQNTTHTRQSVFPMGDYVVEGGIRHYPYDGLDLEESGNPQDYEYINRLDCRTSVHCMGSVWAQILWNVYHELIDTKGFSTDFYYGNAGNNIAMQNVIDGMKLQVCRPNMCDARDAIIQADEINYGGANVCAMWRGFSNRGLGPNADCVDIANDFSLPNGC